MSSFTCKCGKLTREREDESNLSGIMIGLAELQDVEERIGDAVCSFLGTDPEQQSAWLCRHFGAGYPADIDSRAVVSDIISKAINEATFASTFDCPSCTRIAVASPPDRDQWRFHILDADS